MSTMTAAARIAPRGLDAPAPAMTGPTRVGVLGCGYWGPKLIRNFAALAEAELAMVCDLRPDVLNAVGEAYPGLRLTTDVEVMLASDIGAIAIATPVGTHYDLAKRALLAGKHVFVEKPLTTRLHEAVELVGLAEQHGLMLMVGHTFLFEPAVERLRELVQSGELGEIWHVTTHRLNLGLFRRDANVLWDLAPHDVSILLKVLGTEPTVVSARGACHVQPGIQDVAYMDLRFPGGMMAHVHVSWLDPGKVRRMTVVGSQKMAVYDDTAVEKLHVFDRAVVPAAASNVASHLIYRFGETTSIPLPTVEPLRQQCAYFLDCVHSGARPQSDVQLGMNVVRILEQADWSLQNSSHFEELTWERQVV
jgi:predicted dehydrogenase